MTIKKEYIGIAILALIVIVEITLLWIGPDRNKSVASTTVQIDSAFTPLLQQLKKNEEILLARIDKLEHKLDSVSVLKEKAKQGASAAIGRGETAIRNKNFDSLKVAFDDLSLEHRSYVEQAEVEAEAKVVIINDQREIIKGKNLQITTKDVELNIVKQNYNNLENSVAAKDKKIEKLEKKVNRRGTINKILGGIAGAAVIVAGVIAL